MTTQAKHNLFIHSPLGVDCTPAHEGRARPMFVPLAVAVAVQQRVRPNGDTLMLHIGCTPAHRTARRRSPFPPRAPPAPPPRAPHTHPPTSNVRAAGASNVCTGARALHTPSARGTRHPSLPPRATLLCMLCACGTRVVCVWHMRCTCAVHARHMHGPCMRAPAVDIGAAHWLYPRTSRRAP